MKRHIFIKLLSTVLVTLFLALFPLGSGAAGEMAYNIYADPDLSKTSGSFETFMIDFRATDSAPFTYWALANFGMKITPETLKKYPGLCYGGAYAGLQDRGPNLERAGIMSFWHWEYQKNGKTEELNASKLYPTAEDNPFGGEGTGMSSIQPYLWSDNIWYTMVLHTWQDKERGTTFTGQWFLEQSTGKWTLITYYDTHLIGSSLTGGMSFFQENYVSASKDESRSFNTKGMYVLDHQDGLWKSIDSATISYGDGGAANKVGAHEFGAESDYFWGMAGGPVENQAAYEQAATKSQKYSINQPSTPTLGTPTITTLTKQGDSFSWALSEKGTPQLSFKLEIVDEGGNIVYTEERTRPEINKTTVRADLPDEYLYRLTVTDIFGNTTTKEEVTEYYIKDNDKAEDLFTKEGLDLEIHDINGDGKITISDVTALLDFLATSCGHEEVILPATEATCQSYGFTEGSYCKHCGKTLKIQKRIPKLIHKESILEAVAPTCTEPGLTEGKGCLNCGEIYVEPKQVPATGHAYGDDGVCTSCAHSIAFTIKPWVLGFENWSDQTQLLIVAPFAETVGKSLKWEITLRDENTEKTISLFPSSTYPLENGAIFRFECCVALGENRFVPTPGTAYTLFLKVYDGDALMGVGVASEDAKWSMDPALSPIVPQDVLFPEPTEDWALDGGVLTILTDACMNGSVASDYPWHQYRNYITEIIVADGVTKLGNRAFSECPNLRQIICGKDVATLSFDAFAHNPSLTTIVFHGKITHIGQGVVFGTPNIQKITLTGQTKNEFIALSQKSSYNGNFEKDRITWTINP